MTRLRPQLGTEGPDGLAWLPLETVFRVFLLLSFCYENELEHHWENKTNEPEEIRC